MFSVRANGFSTIPKPLCLRKAKGNRFFAGTVVKSLRWEFFLKTFFQKNLTNKYCYHMVLRIILIIPASCLIN